ncbi:hypothetical protein MTO96_004911 [Rhipicephalus appendiculatus]
MSVQVKVEPSRPPSFVPSGMAGVDIKTEPSSSEPMLPLEVTGADIKIEPSSPPSSPSPDPLHTDIREPFEPPILHPTIDPVTTLTSNTEDSASAAAMDSYKRTSEGTTVSPPKKRIQCEMPYACQMCPSKFRKKESFERHMQLHASGVDMWHCLECGKNFTKLTSLLRHLKWHKMEKPHPCHLCPTRFENKHQLEIHMLTHTGEKPHECPVCKRRFSRSSEVKRHMRNIHDRAKITTASTVSKAEITMPSNTLTSLHPENAGTNEKEPAEAAVD